MRARLTPETPTNRHHHKLGVDEGAADGGGNFLCALDTEANVAVVVTDEDKSLEARALASARLLLHGGDLENLVFDRVLKREEAVNRVAKRELSVGLRGLLALGKK
jgi:hypothetical protein